VRNTDRRRPAGPRSRPDTFAADPVQVLSGSVLCRLQVWGEDEWGALPEAKRPSRSVHFSGLGWVGAVPVESMN
jgi:hypothetical protein